MKKTTIKYAAMLQEVQDACKKNERIVGKELGRKYRATNSIMSSLLKLGWIENRSKCRYNWKVGSVTLSMAEELADFINEQTNGKRTQLKVDFKEPKVQQNPKPKKEVKPVKTETTSWFWGLYTKTVKG
jgi:ABC-type uncharacterized transport system YnjBCD substrate-binding protein